MFALIFTQSRIFLSSLLIACILPTAICRAQLIAPSLVKIGEPGNPGDDRDSFKGAVAAEFQMGKYEITMAEYAIFLNAAAKSDPQGLYNSYMSLSSRSGIQRLGAPGAFSYVVKPGYERRPVNFISANNAKRFCNWLHNGANTGSSTETGAYNMAAAPNVRLAGARYFLPNADEWHKAAYYDPLPANNHPSASYWTYATRSAAALPEQINFERHYGGLATDVFFPNYPSFFGTVGQNGNVHELLESGEAVGGACDSLLDGLLWTRFAGADVAAPASVIGFRVAAASGVVSGSFPPLPEPAESGEPLLRPLLSRVGLPSNLGDDAGSDDAFGEVDETSNRGAVPYEFQIGTYEVSNQEYAVFLNSVARADPFRLYNTQMGQPLISEENRNLQGGIIRTGQSGDFSYSARPGFENKPVNFIDKYSAMRFCNWLHNGAQAGSDTEYGAYSMGGRIWQGENGGGGATDLLPIRSASARYYIPTLHEWHKAAFYDPAPMGKPSSSYWLYATRSDVQEIWPANYQGRFGGLVDVNFFRRSSYFGTIAQGGNVAELTITWKKSAEQFLLAYLGGNWNSTSAKDLSSRAAVSGSVDAKHWGLRLAAPSSTVSGAPAPKGSAVQQISFKLPASKRMGPAFKISATSTSRRPVRFESSDPSIAMVSSGGRFNYVFLRSPGTVVITAYEDGDGVWSPAQVSRTLEVLPRAGLRRR